MSVSRRTLLARSAALAASLAASGAAAEDAPGRVADDTLVFVVLRGGADLPSLLVPYRDPQYYRARPTLATGAAQALDDWHALHPALTSWRPWFAARELGAVAGVGFPTRRWSHRDAEEELAENVERALGGAAPERIGGELRPALLATAARIQSGTAPRALWLEHDGWDTHAAQQSRLAHAADELARALVAFRRALGPRWSRTRVVVVSELGRALFETRLGGTEDGAGSALFVLGGRPVFGRVIGSYGSLATTELSEDGALVPKRDLARALAVLCSGGVPV